MLSSTNYPGWFGSSKIQAIPQEPSTLESSIEVAKIVALTALFYKTMALGFTLLGSYGLAGVGIYAAYKLLLKPYTHKQLEVAKLWERLDQMPKAIYASKNAITEASSQKSRIDKGIAYLTESRIWKRICSAEKSSSESFLLEEASLISPEDKVLLVVSQIQIFHSLSSNPYWRDPVVQKKAAEIQQVLFSNLYESIQPLREMTKNPETTSALLESLDLREEHFSGSEEALEEVPFLDDTRSEASDSEASSST